MCSCAQELEADIERQKKVFMNAAMIEFRDRAQGLQINTAASVTTTTRSTNPANQAAPQGGSTGSVLPHMASEPVYEPQSWTPRIRPKDSS